MAAGDREKEREGGGGGKRRRIGEERKYRGARKGEYHSKRKTKVEVEKWSRGERGRGKGESK